jgi:hypothetical protein
MQPPRNVDVGGRGSSYEGYLAIVTLQPSIASTIVVGALSIVELVAGLVLERFSREAESSTQSTCTALLLRTCWGWVASHRVQ